VLPVSTNDGVFANMSAKPESENNKVDETPPVSERKKDYKIALILPILDI
jgi:hypothetical protein